MIPTLETQRLLLRAQTMDDWPDYRDLMMSDRAIYMDGPHSLSAAWGMFCHDLALWSLFGCGALMMDDRESGECVGQICINSGPLFPEHELGWMVYAGHEGKGYAYEAALALREWGFKKRGLKTIVSHVSPENHRSRKLAERLGAELDIDTERPGPEVLVYRHNTKMH